MLSIKAGVDIRGIRPEVVLGIMVAHSFLGGNPLGLTVTSAVEGVHGPGSKHYDGLAFDIRSRDWSPEYTQYAAGELRSRLGGQWDVVVESDHIHVEFDPKG